MKRIYFILLFFAASLTYAQVGIGTATPSDAAMLEVDGGNATSGFKGFMPPRVATLANRDAIMPAMSDNGLMVFVIETGCLDIWNGSAWESVDCLGNNNTVWINEFHYNNVGGDVGEFIEIAGIAGTDLSGFYIIRINGADGLDYGTIITLSGTIDDEGTTGYGAVEFDLAARNGLQNGNPLPDGFALMGPNGLVQFLSYNGALVGQGAPVNNITAEDVGVIETNSTPIGVSLQLEGTGNVYAQFNWVGPQTESPGTLNSGQTIN